MTTFPDVGTAFGWDAGPLPTGIDAGANPGTDGGAGTDGGNGGVNDAGPINPGNFVDLAPAPGAPFAEPDTATPAPPSGWDYYDIDGAECRDGSQMGVYLRDTGSDKLVIFFEGGGACATPGFCNFNPKNMNQVLSGTGEDVLMTAFGAVAGRQQPGAYTGGAGQGIFDESNSANPFRGWNMLYIPYCTGDVHFGSRPNATLQGSTETHQFVGYNNTRLIISRLRATYESSVNELLVTGSSAGSFGAALNVSMIADSFRGKRINALLDSGIPFNDAQMPVCLQNRWREIWNLNDSLPPDCTECRKAGGGDLLGLADFLIRKHPGTNIGFMSSDRDQVMRLFFSPGEGNCAQILDADPVALTIGGIFGAGFYPAQKYTDGLLALRTRFQSTGRMASYLFADPNPGGAEGRHQHVFRARFYQDPADAGVTIAAWTQAFLNGNLMNVGP